MQKQKTNLPSVLHRVRDVLKNFAGNFEPAEIETTRWLQRSGASHRGKETATEEQCRRSILIFQRQPQVVYLRKKRVRANF